MNGLSTVSEYKWPSFPYFRLQTFRMTSMATTVTSASLSRRKSMSSNKTMASMASTNTVQNGHSNGGQHRNGSGPLTTPLLPQKPCTFLEPNKQEIVWSEKKIFPKVFPEVVETLKAKVTNDNDSQLCIFWCILPQICFNPCHIPMTSTVQCSRILNISVLAPFLCITKPRHMFWCVFVFF